MAESADNADKADNIEITENTENTDNTTENTDNTGYSLETLEWLSEQKNWGELIDKCNEAVLALGEDRADPKYFFYRAKAYYETADHTECLTELRSVVLRADISVALRVDCLALKAECLYALEEYETCKETIKSAFAQRSDPSMYKLVNKCNEKLGLTVEKPPPSRDTSKAPSKQSPPSAPVAPKAPVKTFRHEWYQSDTEVVISLLIKKANKEDVTYQFKENHLSVEVRLPNDQSYILNTELFDKIQFQESKVTVLSSKIEIRLKKATLCQWSKLEKDTTQSSEKQTTIKTFSPDETPATTQNPQKFPTSAKTATNWDKLAAQAAKEEAEEKPEGDAALNQFFQQIYGQGSDAQKRAMMKSFQESSGTVLSTNWDEVGKDKVEMKSPDGMEFKKYDI